MRFGQSCRAILGLWSLGISSKASLGDSKACSDQQGILVERISEVDPVRLAFLAQLGLGAEAGNRRIFAF